MEKEIIFELETGELHKMKLPVYEIENDRYMFEMIHSPSLFIFKHDQRHTRLDLSNLREVLIYSFDKHSKLVGITYCNSTALGPYEVHNKQRIFLLTKRKPKLSIQNSAVNTIKF